MQKLAVGRGRDPERLDPGAVRGRRAVRRDGVEVGRASSTPPCRGLRGRLDQRGAGRPRRARAADDHAGAGDLLRARATRTSFAPHHLPLWIWMDDPSYYGFPCYGEPTVKAAQDCGGPVIDTSDAAGPHVRARPGDAVAARVVHGLAAARVGGRRCARCAASTRSRPTATSCSRRCPGHESVVVGLGAAHGFKFAPTFGRLLADLATSGATTSDISRSAWTGPPSPTRRTPPTGWCDEPVTAPQSSENGGYRSVTRSRA